MDLRRKQLTWLSVAEQRTKLNQTGLARLAGVDPSTLSKFKRGRTRHLDNAVVERIASASGVAPYNSVDSRQSVDEAVPFAFDAAGDFSAAVRDYIGGRNNLVPYVLKSPALLGLGYMPGDVVVLDVNADWLPGDIVCAEHWRRRCHGPPQIVFRRYQPPFLVAVSSDPAFFEPIEEKDCDRKGAVRMVMRDPR